MDFAWGALSGLVGSISYALMYVFTEKVQKPEDAPPPVALCTFTGTCALRLVHLASVCAALPPTDHRPEIPAHRLLLKHSSADIEPAVAVAHPCGAGCVCVRARGQAWSGRL